MIVDTETYLEHYGVKGMKWGVRRTPEQLGRDKTSSSKKPPIKKNNQKLASLTPNEALLAVYGGAFAAALIAKGVAHVLDSGVRDARKSKNVEWKQNKELSKKNMTEAELKAKVVKPINSDYGARGTKMNCRRCTMAYEMRRRGMDVKATKSSLATGQTTRGMKKALNAKTEFSDEWGETSIFNAEARPAGGRGALPKAQSVFDSLQKQPNGSRGELGVGWNMGGGHSVAYELVRGKPVIFDTQNGKTYNNPESFKSLMSGAGAVSFTRLDNKQINDDFIRRWVTNV